MTSSPAPLRIHFLDGLRGLCALYVLAYHCVLDNQTVPGTLSVPGKALRTLFGFGHVPVVFFIVLSGFSLMLPAAKRDGFPLNGTLGEYIHRRAKRILPAYYAALAFSLAAVFAYNKVGTQPIQRALDADVIVSHVFLVHNFSFDWAFRINAPMWSIPTEWQIYFVFALLMLPLARKVGFVWTILLSYALGSVPNWLQLGGGDWSWACPWFLGSFALGMTGAALHFSSHYRNSWWRKRAPWGLFSLLTLLAVVTIYSTALTTKLPYSVLDGVNSLFAFSIVNALLCADRAGAAIKRVVAFLGSKALVTLGGFSYSLYLLHTPFLKLLSKGIARLQLNPDAHLAMLLLVLTPTICALAWAFSLVFEKPFLSKPSGSPKEAVVALKQAA